ncbi:MAG: hypothetical protein DRR19_08230 [Candidatus Parabeggiatoa sp. nov. 1]|nr:MAG: hypothetical protein DRR19_08230 [Gammaproteobacteria bacterium]
MYEKTAGMMILIYHSFQANLVRKNVVLIYHSFQANLVRKNVVLIYHSFQANLVLKPTNEKSTIQY